MEQLIAKNGFYQRSENGRARTPSSLQNHVSNLNGNSFCMFPVLEEHLSHMFW